MEEVLEDLDKVDGVVIEEVDFEVEPNQDVTPETRNGNSGHIETADEGLLELPANQEDGEPILLNVQQITYV